MLKRIVWIFAVLLLGACGAQTTEQATTYTTVEAASIKAGDAVPAPQSEPVLTIAGNIGQTNQTDQLVFDMDTLEDVGLVEYTVPDPFLEKDVTYQGVLLKDLLAVAQADAAAATLSATALNDYQINIPFADFSDKDVIIATRRDGERMPVSDKGPLEIVFPYHQMSGFDEELFNAYWIWQLKSLEIQ